MCFPVGAPRSSPHRLFDRVLLKGPFKRWREGCSWSASPQGCAVSPVPWGGNRDVTANLVRCLCQEHWEMGLGESLG